MSTQQSCHLTSAPLSSPRGPASTKTGGFALSGHTLGVRRDPQARLQTFLLSIPITPYASMARRHFTLKYFALMFGTQTRCYVLTGLCAAKKENSLK